MSRSGLLRSSRGVLRAARLLLVGCTSRTITVSSRMVMFVRMMPQLQPNHVPVFFVPPGACDFRPTLACYCQHAVHLLINSGRVRQPPCGLWAWVDSCVNPAAEAGMGARQRKMLTVSVFNASIAILLALIRVATCAPAPKFTLSYIRGTSLPTASARTCPLACMYRTR